MSNKTAATSEPIHDLIAMRWSPRAIDQQKPVERKKLISVLEAARWAPSCFGDEPWRYLVWDRFEDQKSWQQAFDCLAEGNQAWVRNAPILMTSLANSEFTRNGKPNRWGQYDTGAASENLCLQATALGLVAHQMGGFNAEKVKQVFSVPEQFTPMSMIAIGYPGNSEELPEKYRESELGIRKRRALEESFFFGEWNKSLNTG